MTKIDKYIAERVVDEALDNAYFRNLLVELTLLKINPSLIERYLETAFQQTKEDLNQDAGRTDKYA